MEETETTMDFVESKRKRSTQKALMTKLYNELKKNMMSRDNIDHVKVLFQKLCERFEQFKNAHLQCLDLCTVPDVAENLELTYEYCLQNFVEFRERFSQWTATGEKTPEEDDACSVASRISSASSGSAIKELWKAKAKRLVLEHKLKKMKERHEFELASKELKLKKQIINMLLLMRLNACLPRGIFKKEDFYSRWNRLLNAFANSLDPDETPQNVASHQDPNYYEQTWAKSRHLSRPHSSLYRMKGTNMGNIPPSILPSIPPTLLSLQNESFFNRFPKRMKKAQLCYNLRRGKYDKNEEVSLENLDMFQCWNRILKAFANSLDPDETPQNQDPNFDEIVINLQLRCHSSLAQVAVPLIKALGEAQNSQNSSLKSHLSDAFKLITSSIAENIHTRRERIKKELTPKYKSIANLESTSELLFGDKLEETIKQQSTNKINVTYSSVKQATIHENYSIQKAIPTTRAPSGKTSRAGSTRGTVRSRAGSTRGTVRSRAGSTRGTVRSRAGSTRGTVRSRAGSTRVPEYQRYQVPSDQGLYQRYRQIKGSTRVPEGSTRGTRYQVPSETSIQARGTIPTEINVGNTSYKQMLLCLGGEVMTKHTTLKQEDLMLLSNFDKECLRNVNARVFTNQMWTDGRWTKTDPKTSPEQSGELKRSYKRGHIIGTNLLTKFHEDRKINVASRVLTRKNTPPPGSHVFQPTCIIV
ncbi:hypothetical protein DPMN_183855 [Dreissena polymorpha]|uniref:Uncharacterized protein n=1 Tax=Dreissena polymorpha TaxID=45954 RepID=A0A9D4DI51_DREPO|nr:hypothetical protein DPMN_183855 [Dreissena polymorpha]